MRLSSHSILFIAVVCTLAFASCKQSTTDTHSIEALTNYAARGFEIYPTDNGYLLRVLNPSQHSKNNSFEYNLSRTSQHQANTISIPVKNVICCSTTHVAFISALGKESSISGVSGGNHIYNNNVQLLYQQNEIKELGYDNSLNQELIISLKPDIVFAYGIDNRSLGNFQKIEQAGIPVVWIGEYLENQLLGRTEWLKFFACFYDCLDMASETYDSITNCYNNLSDNVSELYNTKPLVISGLPWQGVWYVPGGDSYMAHAIADAGGKYLFDNNSQRESIPLSMEELFDKAVNAKVWINLNNIHSKLEILQSDSRFNKFEPLHSAGIYNNNKRINENGGNDFWESGLIHPDKILNDLIMIFHQNDCPDDSLFYYKKL